MMNNIFWDDLAGPGSTELDMGTDPQWGNNHGTATVYNSIIRDGSWDYIENRVFSYNPIFEDNAHHLSENSPGVGMGKKSIVFDEVFYQAPLYDIDGKLRPNTVDTLIDIGAFESPYPANKFVYPKSLEIADDISYLNPVSDYLELISDIYNPENHSVNVFARIVSVDEAVRDSVELFDDGEHNDGESGDLMFGGALDPINEENTFKMSLGIKDNDTGRYMLFNDSKRITTIGPIKVANYALKDVFLNRKYLNLSLKNDSQTAAAKNITIRLTTRDTSSVLSIDPQNNEDIEISALQTVDIERSHYINFRSAPSDTVHFMVSIYSNNYLFWTDSLDVVTSLENDNQKVPKIFSLDQNVPNPFNPVTSINYQLPKASEVKLSAYNVLGQRVVTLVNERQNVGTYKVEWDASEFASGIYYYRLDAGNFTDVKKMVLLR